MSAREDWAKCSSRLSFLPAADSRRSLGMLSIRPSTSTDADATEIPRLILQAQAWLIASGSSQWGTSLHTTPPTGLAHATPGNFTTGQAFFAVVPLSSPNPEGREVEERVVGAIVLGTEPWDYAPPTQRGREGKEAYLMFLATDRMEKGKDVGGRVLEFGREECKRRGFGWLRGDCFRAEEEGRDGLIR